MHILQIRNSSTGKKKENSSMSTGCTLVPQTLVLGNELKVTKLV
jgi:hypothetical protein